MLLIIEIALTIVAFNRGWKWLAALPILIGIFAGVLLGVAALTGVISQMSLIMLGLAIDGAVIVALIAMCFIKGTTQNASHNLNFSLASAKPNRSIPANPFVPRPNTAPADYRPLGS